MACGAARAHVPHEEGAEDVTKVGDDFAFPIGRLAEAIREAVTHRTMPRRAGEVGAWIRGEDGVGRAVGVLCAHVARFNERKAQGITDG